MLFALDDGPARVLLGAMRGASTGGGRYDLTDAGASAIRSLAVLGVGLPEPDVASLKSTQPSVLAAAVSTSDVAARAIQVLAVAALVDGTLDRARIDQVLMFAEGCGVTDHWLSDLAISTEPDLTPIITDMSDRNLRSITHGRVDLDEIGDINAWLLPYEGEAENEALATRYRELSILPEGTLGREFWAFYDRHGFLFPGQPGAANEMFTTPHDSTHLISGYDTTPQGELLVSTFTAGMHPMYPMEGHILPVIYSWHIGIEFNKLAGSYKGALDAAKFWIAWDRGLQTEGDTFTESFDFWSMTEVPLADIRSAFGVPNLDPEFAAHSDAVPGVDFNPIA